MGIHGLATFVKSKAPHIIRTQLLQEFRGRAVAIDGNVLTLRFHHAKERSLSEQHPNKILLSWYRFIRNLQSYGVKPVVVFDGPNRVSAKGRELAKRLETRRRLTSRAESEAKRVERVQNMLKLGSDLSYLDEAQRRKALRETDQITSAAATRSPEQIEHMLRDTAPLSTRLAGFALQLQGASLAEASIISKYQRVLAQDETQAFTRLLAQETVSDLMEADYESADEAVERLLEKSTLMADNLRRRSKPVGKDTYANSMTIIKAMGVPLLTTSASEPQEAESLCSSLVFSGQADIVISEDTDVLAFGASMLRHVNSASSDGDRICGMEAWKELGFDNHEQWVDFCILCGSDFTERIKNVGPVSASRLIHMYGSIEAILKSGAFDPEQNQGRKNKIVAPQDLPAYLAEVQAAREIFLSPIALDVARLDITPKPESADLKELMRSFGLSEAMEFSLSHRSGFEYVSVKSFGEVL